MLFKNGIIITGVEAFVSSFKKKEEVLVLPRAHHSLTFRLSGSISICTDGVRLISDKDSVTYVPAGTEYRTEVLCDGSMIALHFKTIDAPEEKTTVLHPKSPALVLSLFSAIIERYRLGRERDATCLSLFYELIAELDTTAENRTESPRLCAIRNMRELIANEYSNDQLSVCNLAERIGVSEVYFRREFKKMFGISPIAYICKIRYDNARALLKTGYYTIGEVAERCGYSSINYFSTEFKRLSGVSPSEYSSKKRG